MMNQRIRELMTEAGYAAPELAIRAQKLAELIVEECLLAISKTKVSGDKMSTLVKCHTQVENHFGVK